MIEQWLLKNGRYRKSRKGAGRTNRKERQERPEMQMAAPFVR